MKKKVAICISGHMRDYEKRKDDFFNNFINCNPDYDFDIYISTWDTRSSVMSHSFERRNYKKFEKISIDEVISHYKPLDIFVEENDDNKFAHMDHLRGTNNIRAVVSQFYKINQVGNLLLKNIKEKNTNYCCVIKTRPDAVLINPLILNNLDMNVVNLEIDNFGAWISDKVLVMNLENYVKYIDIYNHLERLYHKIGNNMNEVFLYYYFIENNIPFVKLTELNITPWD